MTKKHCEISEQLQNPTKIVMHGEIHLENYQNEKRSKFGHKLD